MAGCKPTLRCIMLPAYFSAQVLYHTQGRVTPMKQYLGA